MTNIDLLGDWVRTHDCGALRKEDSGRKVVLMGWVNSRRDLGNLIFIDLRDREGITQAVFDPQISPEVHERAHILRNEWVVALKGEVAPRLEGQENAHMPTGDIEVRVTGMKILNITETPPFQVDGAVDASETLRLKYRYLELRRPQLFRNFRKRHAIAGAIRKFLDENGFIEVETPFLTKSTPEGARDYLVPSRVNRGLFYALPQSPQLFKQLLMVAGFDRYYQIVRCFRDEDLRADRQPEFTQVDLEMAFVNEDQVMAVFEHMMARLFDEILDQQIPLPIPRLTYQDAMERFGTDRPDLRFGMELCDVSDLTGKSDFRVFKEAVASGGVVKAIRV
ncbi:MAG: aspartate--tRNA ligase, partial [Deltaproteobacteria bacterium]|nr:aspartate--tRNA ligase [Deltaproteobacteria bacterium]